MLRKIRYHQVLGMAVQLLAVVLLGACSDEAEPTGGTTRNVHLVLGTQGFQDARSEAKSSEVDTRALPTGFTTYGDLYASSLPAHAQIQGFFISSATPTPAQEGVFTFIDIAGKRGWTTAVPIRDSDPYYFYGFLPKEDVGTVNIAPYDSDYRRGAVMTINNMDALTPSDVCVVVGVRLHDTDTDPITSLDMASRLGKFDFLPQDGENYLYLLVDHLYCSLHFRMRIDAGYNELRTIKVKQLRLLVSDDTQAVKSVNATVTLVATEDGRNPLSTQAGGSVSFAVNERGESQPAILYDCADDAGNPDGLALTPELASFRGYLAPAANEKFILESVYDVYDRYGNLIRENEKARNTFSPATLSHGQEYTYNITVKPTYLYMLSEPDLDSPTFTIN